MGFWQLFIFLHVFEQGSFSEAAKLCGLSQPTVSSHIRQLEAHLDCLLFDRIAKKAVPTKIGEILYRYANRLMRLREETETAISEFKGNMRGDVVIGGSTIPGGYLLPGVLAGFRQLFPNTRIFLDIDSTENIIRKLNEGEVELGIVGAKSAQKNIAQAKYIDDELTLVIPVDHRWSKRDTIRFETLKKEPFIKRESGSGTWQTFSLGLKKAGYDIEELNIVTEIKHTQGVISGIRNRLGISVLSPIAIVDELQLNRLKPLKIQSVDLKRSFYLTWHAQRSLSPIARQLKEFIESQKYI